MHSEVDYSVRKCIPYCPSAFPHGDFLFRNKYLRSIRVLSAADPESYKVYPCLYPHADDKSTLSVPAIRMVSQSNYMYMSSRSLYGFYSGNKIGTPGCRTDTFKIFRTPGSFAGCPADTLQAEPGQESWRQCSDRLPRPPQCRKPGEKPLSSFWIRH